jgi:hypothetical protein
MAGLSARYDGADGVAAFHPGVIASGNAEKVSERIERGTGAPERRSIKAAHHHILLGAT